MDCIWEAQRGVGDETPEIPRVPPCPRGREIRPRIFRQATVGAGSSQPTRTIKAGDETLEIVLKAGQHGREMKPLKFRQAATGTGSRHPARIPKREMKASIFLGGTRSEGGRSDP